MITNTPRPIKIPEIHVPIVQHSSSNSALICIVVLLPNIISSILYIEIPSIITQGAIHINMGNVLSKIFFMLPFDCIIPFKEPIINNKTVRMTKKTVK